MKIPTFTLPCSRGGHTKPAEEFHFRMKTRLTGIHVSVNCLQCSGKQYPDDHSHALAAYHRALWKMLQVPILYERELANEDFDRRSKILSDVATLAPAWFAAHNIAEPNQPQMEAVFYYLCAEDIEREVAAEVWRMWTLS